MLRLRLRLRACGEIKIMYGWPAARDHVVIHLIHIPNEAAGKLSRKNRFLEGKCKIMTFSTRRDRT